MDLLQLTHDPVLLLVVVNGIARPLITRLATLAALALVLRGSRPQQRPALLDGLGRLLRAKRR